MRRVRDLRAQLRSEVYAEVFAKLNLDAVKADTIKVFRPDGVSARGHLVAGSQNSGGGRRLVFLSGFLRRCLSV